MDDCHVHTRNSFFFKNQAPILQLSLPKTSFTISHFFIVPTVSLFGNTSIEKNNLKKRFTGRQREGIGVD